MVGARPGEKRQRNGESPQMREERLARSHGLARRIPSRRCRVVGCRARNLLPALPSLNSRFSLLAASPPFSPSGIRASRVMRRKAGSSRPERSQLLPLPGEPRQGPRLRGQRCSREARVSPGEAPRRKKIDANCAPLPDGDSPLLLHFSAFSLDAKIGGGGRHSPSSQTGASPETRRLSRPPDP
jgi:hypothetical protein